MHRDLKPENIVLEKGLNIKIIDFGTATEFDPEEGLNIVVGTPFYMAPEVLDLQNYNEKSDMWAIGVILFILLTGTTPF